MAGRRPKPTQLKILEGNPGKRPLNLNEPHPRAGIPDTPEELGEIGRKHWLEIVPELDRLNLLTLIDAGSLVGLCMAYEQGMTADRILKGIYERMTAGETQRNDLWELSVLNAASKKSWNQYKAFCTEFGLTPASRSKLSAPSPELHQDPLERALCG